MKILYTARGTFDEHYGKEAWEDYLVWNKTPQMKECVTLDGSLGDLIFEPYQTKEDWDFVDIDPDFEFLTDLFTSHEYVLTKVDANTVFNFLAVVREPEEKCENIELDGFEFVGYDLLEKDGHTSSLTNCGGFDEMIEFQNEYGLINDFDKAQELRKLIYENYPGEPHADCKIFAVWRHKTIGRRKNADT